MQKKKWCVINSESNNVFNNESPINFMTNSIKLSLCGYSGVYILVKGDVTVAESNDVFLMYFYVAVVHMYNLIEEVILVLLHYEVYGSLRNMNHKVTQNQILNNFAIIPENNQGTSEF